MDTKEEELGWRRARSRFQRLSTRTTITRMERFRLSRKHLSQESLRREIAHCALHRVHPDSSSAESMPRRVKYDIANADSAEILGRKKAIDFSSVYNCNCIAN
jgi:hypothetical protein